MIFNRFSFSFNDIKSSDSYECKNMFELFLKCSIFSQLQSSKKAGVYNLTYSSTTPVQKLAADV